MTPLEQYAAWIEQYVSAQPSRFVRGKCADATEQMVVAFPELRRACGFVFVQWGRDQHWWCVTPDGTIVDPTAEQFGPCGVCDYEELDLSDPATLARIPTGKCMECGDPAYLRLTFCSYACEVSFCRELGMSITGKPDERYTETAKLGEQEL